MRGRNVVTSAPLISIIVPAYNAEATLTRAMRSVIAQSDGGWELIVVDDGSSDGTLALARSIAEDDEDRISVFTHPNAGCSASRNLGASHARGEFICVLDADDELSPDFVASQRDFIAAHPGFDVYSCNALRVYPGGRTEPFFAGRRFARVGSFTLLDTIKRNGIYVSAAVRRTLWERLGGWRTDLRHAEDYEFWLRALASGARHIYQPRQLAINHVTPTGKSRDRIPHAQAQIRIFEGLMADAALSAEERAACAHELERLQARIDRLELESRLAAGELAGARSSYARLRHGYHSGLLYWVGFAAMMISPRLYVRLWALRAESRLGIAKEATETRAEASGR